MILDLATNLEVGKFEVENYDELNKDLSAVLEEYSKVVVLDNDKFVEWFKSDEKITHLGDIDIEENNALIRSKCAEYGVNFDELNAAIKGEWLTARIVTIKEAKSMRSLLNNASKAFNDKRIELQKKYLAPFEAGKEKIDGLVKDIKSVVEVIDEQVKTYENQYKEKKKAEISAYMNNAEINSDYFKKLNVKLCEILENPKWLNATYNLETIKKEIDDFVSKFNNDCKVIDEYTTDEALKAVMIDDYLKTFDLSHSISISNEFLKKVEQLHVEEEKNENTANLKVSSDETLYTISFRVTGNKTEIYKLNEYLKSNNYNFERIKEEN